jgi:RNA polymerase sigma-70 factor (family 1)
MPIPISPLFPIFIPKTGRLLSDNFTNSEEKTLFRRIAVGDEEAYTRIFHLFTPRLLPYIIKITRNEQLARELLQETFLRLWMRRADLLAVELPDSWLFRIAANLCLTHLRVQANRDRLQPQVLERETARAGASPVEALEARDLDRLIRQAVNALPSRRQEIYRLSREQGLSHAEIADRMGISVSTVKNQLGVSLKFIYERLHDQTGLQLTLLMALFLL